MIANSKDHTRRQEIIDAYFNYFASYTKRDWKAMTQTFSSCLTMFGTGVDEVSTDCEETINFFSREFEQSPLPMEYSVKKLEVFEIKEDVAYLMIVMDMKFFAGEESIEYLNNRTTALMQRVNGSWKLVHGHWSQPAEIQEIGESVPYKILKQRNVILEEKVKERTREIEAQNDQLKAINETKTKLLSIIAHDLRSPFNAFLGLTELMLLNFDDNIKDTQYFKTRLSLMYERAQGLYNVADNLLNWAWTQAEEIKVCLKPLYIKGIVQDQLLALLDSADTKKIKVSVKIPDGLQVRSDREILEIIIRNTISNAIKYSNSGSKVSITAMDQDQQILISILDQGVGMDAETLNRVVNSNVIESRMGTNSEKGTGLGLIICKELIGKVNGTFNIYSKVGKGTELIIGLPKVG